ncbi:hypothetical protein HMPREF1084_02994 [Clostridium butyricum 60E.3]|uniref:flagellin N-terminal helical domain-containing protein n=1 Tax=Clostridium butyricum TaxID=1492 RepID=UPI0002D1E82B|nr:flagellin [Clostridium butyricum]ENZ31475.1 hypothetical protein HMPREF1084_02994 [Clostridium butyricum 60E.3]
MIINHNMGAINAQRNMGINSSAASKSMEKLSSGLRINRAGDDAAGLSISEKMRAQIRGLDQASTNAEDGISMIQTTEGALNETHSILQRMRELSVQASNGTNTDDDRTAIQEEIKQLTDEIDRIGNDTEFNTMKLIDGSMSSKKVAGAQNAAVIGDAVGKETSSKITGTVNFNAGAAKIADVTGDITESITVDGAKIDFTVTKDELVGVSGDTTGASFAKLLEEKINAGIKTYNDNNGKNIANVSVGATGSKIEITSGEKGATSSISLTTKATGAGNLWEIAGMGVAVTTLNGSVASEGVFTAGGAANVAAAKALTGDNAKFTFEVDGKKIAIDLTATGTKSFTDAAAAVAGADMSTIAGLLENDLNAAIDNYNKTVPVEDQVNKINVSVKDGSFVVESGSDKEKSSVSFGNSEAEQLLGLANTNSKTQGGGVEFQIGANEGQTIKVTIDDMRAEALGISKIDLSEQSTAKEATTTIDDAIKKVSAQRANLGAVQNRLEHTINNLGTSSENLTSAESRIRDTDMASEMSEYSKNNILQQAAQAMLAQAKSAPEQVLQLLR